MSQRAFSYPAPSLKEVVLNDRSVTARAISPERDSFDGPNNTKSLVCQLLDEKLLLMCRRLFGFDVKVELACAGVAITVGLHRLVSQ
jgi:hypothetical protein